MFETASIAQIVVCRHKCFTPLDRNQTVYILTSPNHIPTDWCWSNDQDVLHVRVFNTFLDLWCQQICFWTSQSLIKKYFKNIWMILERDQTLEYEILQSIWNFTIPPCPAAPTLWHVFFYVESLTIEEFQLCWHAKSLSHFSLNYQQRYNLHEKINGLFHHLLHLSISLDVALISFLVFMTMSSTSPVISSLKITTKNV